MHKSNKPISVVILIFPKHIYILIPPSITAERGDEQEERFPAGTPVTQKAFQ